ncbi:MAG: PspC domain-containing protein [Candidatus Pacebacteria bacterium]|jgi:phage shock protein C|nr:PspC domain-containing protein [Candidatus Paceibacterota bacterium]MBT4652164.1 PspC domain-containing protein [Candidatus Paceibacterota bacterium]MBT6756702.1 PspC domain-containing protein [Candidatus Paceibacterota bacterium]MBT6920972.1 PspC domain-containing protein [Candidatus Paceibacterota bacterium]
MIKKKLRRNIEDRKIAGVAAGLADFFDVDVILFRLIFVLMLLPGGIPGLATYFVCWLVIPEDK